MAECVVRDYILGEELDFHAVDNESLWTVVPRGVMFKYVNDPVMKEKMKKLIRDGKVVNPLFYGPDSSFKKWLRLQKNQYGHYVKYKKYMK